MALRLNTRGTVRRSTVRSTRALLSFAVAAGLAVPAATAVAAPSDSSSSAEDQTAEAYLADLVGTVSSTEGEVASLELELGGLRESVNKARVDVDRSQRAAQEAQDNVTEARSRLDGSDSEVKDAQSTLDELARSAYTRGGDSAPIALASGSDATGDTIDRATYMRMAAEKQQADIDKLDLARTQAANEESSLRVSRDDADGLVTAARDAHSAAEKAFTDAQSTISAKSAELE
ncbi:MAG: resuscitation-promoting factor interacting protein, partial [Corynebacterium sp.]|nr:resuscitation-promoting factor interacting protein [Corynebacterium sp.]